MPLIYIVDDDDAVTKSLKRLLCSLQMRVRTFSSGEAFLSALEISPQHVDCAVIDIRMPVMTGLEVQQHMNSADLKVPVIFITAHEICDYEEQALGGGAIGILKKPFSEEALVNLIDVAAKRRQKAIGAEASKRESEQG